MAEAENPRGQGGDKKFTEASRVRSDSASDEYHCGTVENQDEDQGDIPRASMHILGGFCLREGRGEDNSRYEGIQDSRLYHQTQADAVARKPHYGSVRKEHRCREQEKSFSKNEKKVQIILELCKRVVSLHQPKPQNTELRRAN